MKTKKQIKQWLDEMGVKDYTINKNLIVDVEGDVNLSHKKLKKFPVQFGKVRRNFYCSYNQLKSLKGAPQDVRESYDCSYNQLKSLKGAPQDVGWNFDCSHNQIKSLKGAPQDVGKSFFCSHNQIKSLKGAPQKVRDFYCSYNQLKSLKGAPQDVGWSFFCHNNQLKSVPKWIENIKNVYVFENLNWNNVEWINKILGDKLTAEEVFAIDNIEHRRVAYQYMDKSKMKQLKDYKILDTGTDEKGNPAKIVSFTVQNMKEPLLFYDCICPSSGREYFIQTEKKTWKEAKATSFGLEEVEFINEW